MNTLFDLTPPNNDVRQARPERPPHNGTSTSRAGAAHIAPEAGTLRSIIAAHLWRAGPVSRDGSVGGATIQELAAVCTRRRGPTKETSITGRLDELWREGLVFKTTLTRQGNAGVNVSVWVHAKHWSPWMGDGKEGGR